MRKLVFIFMCLLSFIRPAIVNAQGDFFFNLYGGSTNLWSSAFLQLPTKKINELISYGDGGGGSGTLRYDIFKIKNAGEKVNVDNGSYWGFKSKDMFSNVQYGLKFGWQPELSPFGIYVSCAYQFNKFKAQFDSNINSWERYKIHSIQPGIGIRITPFINMLEDDGWSPIIEVGTSYNYYFNCSAPFDSNRKQFNSGMISTFAVGARLYEKCSITGGVELNHYSMFNKDFTPDGATYPYKDIETKKLTIFISVSHDF